jgi:hypothetical protein
MMILFTDGRDSTSILTEAEVVGLAGRSNTAVFAISREGLMGADLFRKLAAATGGAMQTVPMWSFTVTGANQASATMNTNLLDEPFLKALDDFRSSYVVRYNLTGVPRPGWHAVTVTVPKGKNYVIRTRSGYAG